MPSKCEYETCERVDLNFVLTERRGDELITRNYCSGIHVALGILDDWTDVMKCSGNKALKQAYRMAVSILKKLAKHVKKEWISAEPAK